MAGKSNCTPRHEESVLYHVVATFRSLLRGRPSLNPSELRFIPVLEDSLAANSVAKRRSTIKSATKRKLSQ
jgi:hypothetical protein